MSCGHVFIDTQPAFTLCLSHLKATSCQLINGYYFFLNDWFFKLQDFIEMMMVFQAMAIENIYDNGEKF